jgi:hypothetical protein
MSLTIPPGLNFFHTVNTAVSNFMRFVSKTQIYLDDWEKNPEEVHTRIKTEFALYMQANAQFLQDVNDYIQNYTPPVPDENNNPT